MGVGGSSGLLEGRDREKRSAGGANIDNVPVPVLDRRREQTCNPRSDSCYLSGLCSPFCRIRRIKSRYWYSSCASIFIGLLDSNVVSPFDVEFSRPFLVAVAILCSQFNSNAIGVDL